MNDNTIEQVLILSKRYSNDSQLLYKAALEAGWKTWRFTSEEIPEWVFKACVSIYCETAIAEYLAAKLNISLYNPPDDILTRLPVELVKRKIQFVLYENFEFPEYKSFIKPADYKYFPAGIYTTKEEIPGVKHCQPDDPILISEVVKFVDEYRLFVLNNKIVTGSPYVMEGVYVGDDAVHYSLPDSLIKFADQVVGFAKDELLHAYVLDIGKLDTGEYAVIEFNPAWGSGVYGADPAGVLQCVAGSCLRNVTQPCVGD